MRILVALKAKVSLVSYCLIFFYMCAVKGKLYWIYRRRNPQTSLTRMGYLPLSRWSIFLLLFFYVYSLLRDFFFFFFYSGEPWYLRQLLLHKPAANYIDLKTIRASDIGKRQETATSIVEGARTAAQPNVLLHFNALLAPLTAEAGETAEIVSETFATFQEACVARGLCTDITEAVIAFSESVIFCSPAQLRGFFVLLTIQGFPTLHIFNVDELRDAMTADYRQEFPLGDIAANK